MTCKIHYSLNDSKNFKDSFNSIHNNRNVRLHRSPLKQDTISVLKSNPLHCGEEGRGVEGRKEDRMSWVKRDHFLTTVRVYACGIRHNACWCVVGGGVTRTPRPTQFLGMSPLHRTPYDIRSHLGKYIFFHKGVLKIPLLNSSLSGVNYEGLVPW